jgi:hypothetical protein
MKAERGGMPKNEVKQQTQIAGVIPDLEEELGRQYGRVVNDLGNDEMFSVNYGRLMLLSSLATTYRFAKLLRAVDDLLDMLDKQNVERRAVARKGELG